MNKSESIGKLLAALAVVQGKIKSAKFDSVNPFFKSKYASLGAVVESGKDLLSANGLAVSQLVSGDVAEVQVETLLGHASGEWMSATLKVKPGKADAQGMGSAITYARRYAYAAIVGIVTDEDDDGNGAVHAKTETIAPPQAKKSVKDEPKQAEDREVAEPSMDFVQTIFKKVATKTGKNAKGEWVRTYAKGEDGQWYQTFSQTIGARMQELEGINVNVTYKLVKDEKGESRSVIAIDPDEQVASGTADDDELPYE